MYYKSHQGDEIWLYNVFTKHKKQPEDLKHTYFIQCIFLFSPQNPNLYFAWLQPQFIMVASVRFSAL